MSRTLSGDNLLAGLKTAWECGRSAAGAGEIESVAYLQKDGNEGLSRRLECPAGMTLTPWGKSSSLRQRRLKPGPGTPREEVEKNQRERFFGAMVAAVAEKGYEGTTVADLARISGVSSRTFYDLFGDKRSCFVAAMQATVELAVAAAAAVSMDEQIGDWEERTRAGARTFAELIVAQPAASRMVLIEAPVVGGEALEPLANVIAGFEALSRAMVAQSPERAGMPPEMTAAYIGAMEEVVRMRLLAGEQDRLPDLMDEIWELTNSYRPPPEPLRLATRPPVAGEESLEAHDHAERAIRAFAVVVAERGYAATTVGEVLKRAQMSASTFYASFRGKEDAMLAAIDSAGAQMGAAVGPAVRRAADWPQAVRAACGALFNFLASRPALARLVAVEVYAAGPKALERRIEHLRPLEDLMAEGEAEGDGPAINTELIGGVIYSLSRRTIAESGTQALPALAPLCAYLALAPFLGPDEACAVANERDRGRGAARM